MPLSTGSRSVVDTGRSFSLRVLIVEDDMFLAIAMAEELSELGLDIVSRASSVAQALQAIAEHSIDAAVLDVNLGNEKVYPAADALQARGIPFVFVTADPKVDSSYAHVPLFGKPYRANTIAGALSIAAKNRE